MKCHHGLGLVNPWDNILTQEITAEGARRSVCVLICWRCGHWLSLGPSDDEPEAVKIEMRAAELAALYDEEGDDPDDAMFVAEFNGWEKHRSAYRGGVDEQQAPGYLAREIATHQGAE